MNDLRIVSLVHSFEPGGVERVALRLCRAWQAAGADVTVLVGRCDGPLREEAPRLRYVSYSSGPICTRPFETLWMIVCFWRWLRKNQPDVIFCPGNTYSVVTAAMRMAFGRNCPPIVCKVSNSLRRDEMPGLLRFGYRLWLRAQGGQADTWVAMAGSLRHEISTLMSVPTDRLAVVEDPALSLVEIESHVAARAEARQLPRRGRLFISVGRLVPQKRFDLLIRAFCRGARDGDRLTILGDGPMRASLRGLARKLGMADRISLVGYTRDVGGWLALADVLVIASDYEGLPAVAVEALASGVPILATRCSDAMAELIGDREFGSLVDCNDEVALATAIGEELATAFDAVEARAMAARFTVECAGPAYLAIMSDALERRRAQAPEAALPRSIVERAGGILPAAELRSTGRM